MADYKALLKENLIRPTTLEIWVMKADGTGKAPDHQQRQSQLRALLLSRRQAHHLRIES